MWHGMPKARGDSGGDGKCGAGCLKPAVIAAEMANVARDA